jgi:hypothetical protein
MQFQLGITIHSMYSNAWDMRVNLVSGMYESMYKSGDVNIRKQGNKRNGRGTE